MVGVLQSLVILPVQVVIHKYCRSSRLVGVVPDTKPTLFFKEIIVKGDRKAKKQQDFSTGSEVSKSFFKS